MPCKTSVQYFVPIYIRGSYSVAREAASWSPCCWLEGGAEPAAAMVAWVRRGVVGAGCWAEAGEGASCSWVEAADLQETRVEV